jgi:hypothetical protein
LCWICSWSDEAQDQIADVFPGSCGGIEQQVATGQFVQTHRSAQPVAERARVAWPHDAVGLVVRGQALTR